MKRVLCRSSSASLGNTDIPGLPTPGAAGESRTLTWPSELCPQHTGWGGLVLKPDPPRYSVGLTSAVQQGRAPLICPREEL